MVLGFVEMLVSKVLIPLLSNELVVSLIVAFVLGWIGIRKWVRERAWLAAYEEKRDLVNRFVDLLNEAGKIVWIVGEVKDMDDDPLMRQGLMIDTWAHARWGPDFDRAYSREVRSLIPDKREIDRALGVLNRPPGVIEVQPLMEVTQQMASARNAMLNLLIDDYHKVYMEIMSLRSRLIMRLRNPDIPTPAVEHATEVFGKLMDGTLGDTIDYDTFADEWGEEMTPVKIQLKRDLAFSVLSLRRAIGLGWSWYAGWRFRKAMKGLKNDPLPLRDKLSSFADRLGERLSWGQ